LSDSAVVLMHDTAEKFKDYGVYRLWAELAAEFPSFEFPHGHGLGVLGVGKHLPADVKAFLEFANSDPQMMQRALGAIGKRDALFGVLHVVFEQQQAVNQWRRRVGLPITPGTDAFNAALNNPPAYLRNAANEVNELIRRDLANRKDPNR